MIIRRRHTANYTTIGNALFEDDRLAADEVGILAFLLSRPHDWEVRRPALSRRWNMGRDAIMRVITNFVRTGWCRAERARRPDGTTFVIYEIRDEPGPALSDDEVKRALSLASSEAVSDRHGDDAAPDVADHAVEPPTGYPSLVDPSPDRASVAYSNIQTTDLTKDELHQKQVEERARVRAKEKHALNLIEFKRRYPSTSSDSQTRIDEAWFALTLDEGEAAIAGIVDFLAKCKKDKRIACPAFTYLRERRWTLLAQQAAAAAPASYQADSVEAKAIAALYEIGGISDLFYRTVKRGNVVYYRHALTPKVLRLAELPPRSEWVALDHRQAGAWEGLLSDALANAARSRMREGMQAPWPWPPSVDGKIYSKEDKPPEAGLSDDDASEFK